MPVQSKPGRARSIHLDVDVDVANKLEWGEEADGAEHQEEYVAGEDCVAEELDRLQQARHVGALEVVKEGVEENEEPGRAETRQTCSLWTIVR